MTSSDLSRDHLYRSLVRAALAGWTPELACAAEEARRMERISYPGQDTVRQLTALRAVLTAAPAPDAAALGACSDYRQERGLSPLGTLSWIEDHQHNHGRRRRNHTPPAALPALPTPESRAAAKAARERAAACKLVREHAGAKSCHPIIVVTTGAGARRAPHLEGKDAYCTTPSGRTIVHHPNAYGYRVTRHPSTKRVEVGALWLARRGLSIE